MLRSKETFPVFLFQLPCVTSWKRPIWIRDPNTPLSAKQCSVGLQMGLFTKAHRLKLISLIFHTSFLGCVSFRYCRTSADSKRKKTPKFWFCSTVGPGLHVQPGPKANKRNRWHPSKGSHPGSISHYTNLHRLFCITNGCTVAFKVVFEYQ